MRGKPRIADLTMIEEDVTENGRERMREKRVEENAAREGEGGDDVL
jgi:hypothetical protein